MYAINIRANGVKWVENEKNELFVDEFKKLKKTKLYKDNHENKWYCDGTIVIEQSQTADGMENLVVASMCANDVQGLMTLLAADSIIHKELQSLTKIVEDRVSNNKYSQYPWSVEGFFPFDQRIKCSKCQPAADPYR